MHVRIERGVCIRIYKLLCVSPSNKFPHTPKCPCAFHSSGNTLHKIWGWHSVTLCNAL